MNWSLLDVAEVPAGVVTVTSTVPADSAGDTPVMEVSPFTVKLVAGTEPNMTELAPVKPAPVIATDVPPAVDPDAGLMAMIMGDGATVVVVAPVVVVVGDSVVVVVAPVVVVVGASVVVVVAPVVVVVIPTDEEDVTIVPPSPTA